MGKITPSEFGVSGFFLHGLSLIDSLKILEVNILKFQNIFFLLLAILDELAQIPFIHEGSELAVGAGLLCLEYIL